MATSKSHRHTSNSVCFGKINTNSFMQRGRHRFWQGVTKQPLCSLWVSTGRLKMDETLNIPWRPSAALLLPKKYSNWESWLVSDQLFGLCNFLVASKLANFAPHHHIPPSCFWKGVIWDGIFCDGQRNNVVTCYCLMASSPPESGPTCVTINEDKV